MTEPSVPQSARPEGGCRENPITRSWHFIVESLAVIGTVMICVLMLIICADIIARNIMGSSLPLVSEAGALLVVLMVALQLAAAIRADRLARTEIFIGPLCERLPRTGALLSAFFDLAGALVLGLVAWATIRILEKDYGAAEFIGIHGIATLQTWPCRLLILVGFAVAAIEFLVRAHAALRAAGRSAK
jgi:TRAP-type C4-dicarboxylate transport system permease small subunit